jgi:hypothetical protein
VLQCRPAPPLPAILGSSILGGWGLHLQRLRHHQPPVELGLELELGPHLQVRL